MRDKLQRIFYFSFLFVAVNTGILNSRKFSTTDKDNGRSISLALRVCQNTIQKSGQSSFYLADFNSDPSVPALIQTLQTSSISTVLTTHYCELTNFPDKPQVRNILFFLDDIEAIPSLILSSASREKMHHEDCKHNKIKRANLTSSESRRMRTFPSYCITVDGHSQLTMDQICDERMFISSDELIGSLVLSDQNLNLTRGLYTNPIWNSNNYLIFMLSEIDPDLCHPPTCVLPPAQNYALISGNKTFTPNGNDAMSFCFKFFWRFFRGLKTIICYKEIGCSRYDPFTENILWYEGGNNESYFEFSVTNMHKKTLRLMVADYEGGIVMDWYLENWMQTVLNLILAALTESLNCTTWSYLRYASDTSRKTGHEIGQKFDVDLHQVELGATMVDVDYSKFDFSVGVETEAICVLTPHSKLVPQCLVPFKVFTVPAWIFIVITVAAFVLTQHIFLRVHSGCLYALYSEREISLFHNFSSVYTVYAYFMCGSPPRLLLGRLFTGKILFLIFSFSALIITTIFLGGMTTLLTNTVHYPEIDTLKDLEGSDLSIQVKNIEVAGTYFAQLGLSEEMRAKLACSLHYYTTTELMWLMEKQDNGIASQLFGVQYIGNETGYNSELAVVSEQFTKNVHAIMEEDAFLISLPLTLSRLGNDIILTKWPANEEVEYHLVPECLKSNSYFFTFMKNSFWFDAYNRKAAQFLESGLVGKTFEPSQFTDQPEAAPPPPKNDEPRPYGLNDLQLPFFILVLGLLLSLIVFVAEIVVEDFENVLVIRQLRHFKKYLSVKTLIRK